MSNESNVLIIKVAQMEAVVNHLTAMGLTFTGERHGDGPYHYAALVGDKVLEIYPGGKEGRVRFHVDQPDPVRVWDDKLKQYVYVTDAGR